MDLLKDTITIILLNIETKNNDNTNLLLPCDFTNETVIEASTNTAMIVLIVATGSQTIPQIDQAPFDEKAKLQEERLTTRFCRPKTLPNNALIFSQAQFEMKLL